MNGRGTTCCTLHCLTKNPDKLKINKKIETSELLTCRFGVQYLSQIEIVRTPYLSQFMMRQLRSSEIQKQGFSVPAFEFMSGLFISSSQQPGKSYDW